MPANSPKSGSGQPDPDVQLPERALERMQYEAEQVGAEGIVGARILEGTYGWDAHVIEFFALGTAVMPTRADHEIEKPQMVISLNDAG